MQFPAWNSQVALERWGRGGDEAQAGSVPPGHAAHATLALLNHSHLAARGPVEALTPTLHIKH